MSAGTPERQRTAVVERALDAIARLDDADRVDRREDAAIARIHQHVHRLEEIDQLEDATRAALREDLRVVVGYVDRLAPEQLPLIEAAAS